ncbi:trophoblast glycoprotein [Haemorhous mexicanus]|uniref:trophoblast glycoprotein n=1 Tax=Haemorhous mexicanus TaxID=30427 RepID=UPI0028BF21F0|nr:trophoblast glycoprotein [Haemorhous mexicanus]
MAPRRSKPAGIPHPAAGLNAPIVEIAGNGAQQPRRGRHKYGAARRGAERGALPSRGGRDPLRGQRAEQKLRMARLHMARPRSAARPGGAWFFLPAEAGPGAARVGAELATGLGAVGGELRRSLLCTRGGRSRCGKRSGASPRGEKPAPDERAARSRPPPRRAARSRRLPEGKVACGVGPGVMPGRGALCLGLLLPVLLGSGSAQPGGCPALCECSEPARTVKCVNKNLTAVPPDLPPYVRSLFITGNPLTDLPAGAFPAQRLPDLASLNLSGNHLRTVEAGSLALPALRQLDLSGNALVSFSPQAFGEGGSPLEELALRGALRDHGVLLSLAALLQSGALRNLSRLELADNGLLLLPAGMFAALPALRQLDLSNNSLVSLRNVSFQGLGQLQSLNLSDNSLGVLWNSTLAQFRSLPALRHIVLHHNTWVCDCTIEDLVAWLKESDQVEGKEALTCASPDKMLGKALLKINGSDLNCSVPIDLPSQLQTSYVFLGIVLALIGAIFLLVLYLNRKGIKKWMHNIRDACRDHMEGYHYRYEINADPRLTNLSSNSDV